MFQTDSMSPRTLNVEKLEKKFASLTKSRESILGLSTWIIRHKEFYKEIVDQWLNALSKGIYLVFKEVFQCYTWLEIQIYPGM